LSAQALNARTSVEMIDMFYVKHLGRDECRAAAWFSAGIRWLIADSNMLDEDRDDQALAIEG